jgi:ribosomal protein L25 (general stress protein Ctc)
MAQTEKIIVETAPRSERGKNEARRLRQTGRIPAVLYGGKGNAITLSVNAKQVGAILRPNRGTTRFFRWTWVGSKNPRS